MYCIAILTDQEQEGQNCAEYIRNYCTEKKVFPSGKLPIKVWVPRKAKKAEGQKWKLSLIHI